MTKLALPSRKAVMVLTSIFGAAVQSVAQDPAIAQISQLNAPQIEKALVKAAAANPVIVNAVSAEPWWRSRIGVGNLVAALAPAIGWIVGHTLTADDQLQITIAVWLVVQAAGVAYSTWGRFRNGLAPMWTRLGGLFGRR